MVVTVLVGDFAIILDGELVIVGISLGTPRTRRCKYSHLFASLIVDVLHVGGGLQRYSFWGTD